MKRIQVNIPETDLQERIAAECKRTGLKESQLLRLIVNKYYYETTAQKLKEISKAAK